MRRPTRVAALAALLLASALLAGPAAAAEAQKSEYRGWPSLALSNGIVEVQVVPDIGGRVIQLSLGGFEYLWVNPRLAGKPPTPDGLGPDKGWLNYGGDKLWPAPQGWDGEDQWPGPPDGVLDGSPHRGEITAPSGPGGATVRLTSPESPRCGIQFSRTVTLSSGASRVAFASTMKNTGTKPRRWGIWQVTQLNAASRTGAGYNKEIRCYAPVNPASIHPRGYVEMFGLVNNPSFSVVTPAPGRRLVCANYRRIVGKIGVDCSAGWTATVDGESGHVFAEMFACVPDRKYPDNASVEFWMNGAGQLVCGPTVVESKDDPVETPHLVESEILSPFAELQPGESYTFHNAWGAARIGGSFPAIDCTAAGVTCEPLTAARAGDKVALKGRFGVFAVGKAEAVFRAADGKECGTTDLAAAVSPLDPFVLAAEAAAPAEAETVSLVVREAGGKAVELARAAIRKP